jgi:methylmalonyl-CoA mutase cobalamin-binding domain/chain
MNPLNDLALLIQHGENVQAVKCAEKLLNNSCSVEDIISAVSKGLAILRNKCTIENFQLLDVLLASRAMVEVVDECIARKLENDMDRIAEKHEATTDMPKEKTIVIGTIQGDVHDLGKHVVATLCRFNNFHVVNLGKDVPIDSFVKAAIKEKADFIGVSSLMTVCLPKIKHIKDALVIKGYEHIKVVGGGSAVQQSSADTLNLDYLAYDSFDGLDYFCNFTK